MWRLGISVFDTNSPLILGTSKSRFLLGLLISEEKEKYEGCSLNNEIYIKWN